MKQAIGRYAASSLSPEASCAAIRAGMQRALAACKNKAPASYAFTKPVVLEVVFTSTARADVASLLPGSERMDGRTVRYRHDDFMTVFQAFRAMMTLGGSIE